MCKTGVWVACVRHTRHHSTALRRVKGRPKAQITDIASPVAYKCSHFPWGGLGDLPATFSRFWDHPWVSGEPNMPAPHTKHSAEPPITGPYKPARAPQPCCGGHSHSPRCTTNDLCGGWLVSGPFEGRVGSFIAKNWWELIEMQAVIRTRRF